MKKKLNIGCGSAKRPDCINIDIKKTKYTDLVYPADKLPYKDGEIDSIESYHMFEHLGLRTRESAIKEWHRVLKKKGNLILEIPDAEVAMRIALRDRLCGDMRSIYGLERYEYDNHLWGYSRKSIKEFLEDKGFKVNKVTKGTDYHSRSEPCMRVEAVKI